MSGLQYEDCYYPAAGLFLAARGLREQLATLQVVNPRSSQYQYTGHDGSTELQRADEVSQGCVGCCTGV